MSTSDSDCSIGWLANDEDVSNSPFSPQLRGETPGPPPSSSPWLAGLDSVSPVQGFSSACELQTLPGEAEPRPTRKRITGDGSDTENKRFSHKCYIQPLGSILRGLKSGRYSERLSSFQESVAIDRIQRIMGVLQNPDMRGSRRSIMLKIEAMLQSWFPHIRANKLKQHHRSSSPPPSASTPSLEVTQDSSVSSSTDWGPSQLHRGPSRLHPPFTISSPYLEKLLQAKDSIIILRTEACQHPNGDLKPVLDETGSHCRTGRSSAVQASECGIDLEIHQNLELDLRL